MGNNQAFTAFEATVIAAHNKGVLDEDLLYSFMEVYRDTDIDSGGMVGTLTSDGLGLYEVCLKVCGKPVPVRHDLPKDHKTWTEEQYEVNDAYHEAVYESFDELRRKFGWW